VWFEPAARKIGMLYATRIFMRYLKKKKKKKKKKGKKKRGGESGEPEKKE